MRFPGKLALCVAILAALASGAPHRLRVHPNPSIVIRSIAEGPDGTLWLATEDGMFRFDGMHYRRVETFPNRSPLHVGFTQDGRVWGAGAAGVIRQTAGDEFGILAKDVSTPIAVLPGHLLIAGDARQRGFSIGLDGSLHPLSRVRGAESFFLDHRLRAWYSCHSRRYACWIAPDPPYEQQIAKAILPFPAVQAAADANDGIWAANDTKAEPVPARGGGTLSRRASRRIARPGPLVSGRGGKLWFVGETVYGIDAKLEFRDRDRADHHLPTTGLEDSRGRFWVASYGQGLIEWFDDSSWERWFPTDYGATAAGQIVRAANGILFLATRDNLYRFDPQSRSWNPIAKEPREYFSMLPLDDGGFLATARAFGLVRLNSAGEAVESIESPLKTDPPRAALDNYRLIARDRMGRVWLAHKASLLRLEGRPGSYRQIPVSLPMARPWLQHAIDIEEGADGRVWVGFSDGIAWRDEQDRWHRLATDQPIEEVRSFTLGGNRDGSDIWVAFRRAGEFARLERRGERWHVTKFEAANGYGPVDTHFLKRDSRGWIWRGSTEGVHISDGVHVAPDDWLHLGMDNGLATNSTDQYGFFEDTDGSVWISGEAGVTHMRPDLSWFTAPAGVPAPRVTHFEDGQTVRIEIGSFHTAPFRDKPFRYRLLPADPEWRLSADGTLAFAGLAAGSYTLEAGYTGTGPSEISRYSFQAGPAAVPFPWTWLLPVPVAGALAMFLARGTVWSDRVRFRVSKSLFFLKRRWSGHRVSASPANADPPANLSGKTFLDRYRLVNPLARSGFSVVYEAVDTACDRRVAVKVLNATTADNSGRDRFVQEVMALQTVDHPGVVRILDSWIGPGGEPCLAMPLLEGPTLRAVLAAGVIPAWRVAELTRRIGSALGAIHARGVVHRDLKPENIVLARGESGAGQPVLIDFGTAGLRGAENELAATTLLAGSFYYLAPERLSGQYSPATDVYALGVIVLEMLTGKRLAEVNALPGDPGFERILAGLLESAVGAGPAQAVAQVLAETYEPNPRNRPKPEPWAERAADLLETVAP